MSNLIMVLLYLSSKRRSDSSADSLYGPYYAMLQNSPGLISNIQSKKL